jgi:hypothetical protein
MRFAANSVPYHRNQKKMQKIFTEKEFSLEMQPKRHKGAKTV